MQVQLRRLKVAKGGALYVFTAGMIIRAGTAVTAAVPYDCGGLVFAAALKELDPIIARMPNPALDLDEATMVLSIRSGRFSARVAVLDADLHGGNIVQGDRVDFTEGAAFLAAATALAPFVAPSGAPKPFSQGVFFSNRHAYATNNVVAARVALPARVFTNDCILPLDTIIAIANCPTLPVAFSEGRNGVVFYWPDGSWLKSRYIADKFPLAQLEALLEKQPTYPSWEIPKEWKDGYFSISDGGDGYVDIHPDKVVVTPTGAATLQLDMPTPVRQRTAWNVKYLSPVLKTATHWTPDDYPRPTHWHGDNIAGIVIGMGT